MVDTGSKNYLTIALEEVAAARSSTSTARPAPAAVARILLGVSGGIAAYKALELVAWRPPPATAVRAVQTPASQRFVGAASFAALTGAPVLTDEFERDPARGAFPDQARPDHDPLSHLELVRNADVFVIAPATANTIAKLAAGLAEHLVTSAALAATCPVLVAPAMNHHMWEHPSTRANVATLRAPRRHRPRARCRPAGLQGRVGQRAACPSRRACWRRVEALLAPRAAGQRAAAPRRPARASSPPGGTREPIDAVRFLGNRSSGRMGLRARRRGRGARRRRHRRRRERHARARPASALRRRRGPHSSCRMPAAPSSSAATSCSWRPPSGLPPGQPGTRPSSPSADGELRVDFERTPDILAGLASARRPAQTIVGFADEDRRRRARARPARRSSPASASTRSSLNDISRSDNRLRRPRQRGDDPHRRRRGPHRADVEGRGRAGRSSDQRSCACARRRVARAPTSPAA